MDATLKETNKSILTENNTEFMHTQIKKHRTSKAFWVIWAIELWERFGYYGVQAILALYFVKELGYTEAQSFYVFGSFAAFVYGFTWIGGWIGDKYLGAKETLLLGVIVLGLGYSTLALSTHQSIFYALAIIVVGNTLYKANSSSLITKLYDKGDVRLDSAITYYYMAVNLGSIISMSLVPIIAANWGWQYAFWLCALGLFLGIVNYIICRSWLDQINTTLGNTKQRLRSLCVVLFGGFVTFLIVSKLLENIKVTNIIVYTVVTFAFGYFLKTALFLKGQERMRMLVAFVLILQGVLFFVMYYQMPTSLTFFALHNINNHVFGFTIPAAEYQVLNPMIILLGGPILARVYGYYPATHVTKFCIGMTLGSLAFLVLSLPQFTATDGFASPLWLVVSYLFQSIGELLIGALGVAMVAELCPSSMTGFVMGIWYLTSMLAGPLGAWVGAKTTPAIGSAPLTAIASMHVYGSVFFKIGFVTGIISIIMWIKRPFLNRMINNNFHPR